MEPTEQTQPSPDDLQRVIARQGRVIEMLRDQISHIVLANTEQAAQIEEMGETLRRQSERLAFEAPPEA